MSPVDAELLEACDLNYAEALRELTRRAGGEVSDHDGLLLYAAADPFPALQDGVMRTHGQLEAGQVLTRAREFFARRKRGFSVIIRAHVDDDLRAAATAAGMTQLGDAPGMVLDRRLPDAVPPDGVTLRRVRTPADAAAFGAVMGAAYASLGFPPHLPPRIFAHTESLIGPHIVAFLACLGDEAAAGAMTIVTHGVAGVYWVGTTPAARGRGLAELCTRAAGNTGFDLGARVTAGVADGRARVPPHGLRRGHSLSVLRVRRRARLRPLPPPARGDHEPRERTRLGVSLENADRRDDADTTRHPAIQARPGG